MKIDIDLSYYRTDPDFMYDMIKREYVVREEVYNLLLDYKLDENADKYFNDGYGFESIPNSKAIDEMVDAIIENGLESKFIRIIENNYSEFSSKTILYIMNLVLHDSARDDIISY